MNVRRSSDLTLLDSLMKGRDGGVLDQILQV